MVCLRIPEGSTHASAWKSSGLSSITARVQALAHLGLYKSTREKYFKGHETHLSGKNKTAERALSSRNSSSSEELAHHKHVPPATESSDEHPHLGQRDSTSCLMHVFASNEFCLAHETLQYTSPPPFGAISEAENLDEIILENLVPKPFG